MYTIIEAVVVSLKVKKLLIEIHKLHLMSFYSREMQLIYACGKCILLMDVVKPRKTGTTDIQPRKKTTERHQFPRIYFLYIPQLSKK